MDRFETDLMEDLMADAAEGPAQSAMDGFDEYDGYDDDGFDADGGDEGDDEFIGRLLGGIGGIAGRLLGGGGGDGFDEFDEADGFEASGEFDEDDGFDDFDADGYDSPAVSFDDGDAMEEAVADALDADDGDEFFRRIARLARGAVNVARRVGQGVGQVARVVGPIASMIPIPQAQAIGRIANIAGRLLADGADEFEAFDELVDGLDEDGIDAAAPVLAGMVIRRALPGRTRAAPRPRRGGRAGPPPGPAPAWPGLRGLCVARRSAPSARRCAPRCDARARLPHARWPAPCAPRGVSCSAGACPPVRPSPWCAAPPRPSPAGRRRCGDWHAPWCPPRGAPHRKARLPASSPGPSHRWPAAPRRWPSVPGQHSCRPHGLTAWATSAPPAGVAASASCGAR